MKQPVHGARLRERLAHEAARIVVEGGIADFRLARRKAAERLRVSLRAPLPRDQDIDAAVRDYRRLFGTAAEVARARALRDAALEAMRLLDEFRPRLVADMLDGGATRGADVCLHLFADPPELVALFLAEHGIDSRDGEARLRVAGGDMVRVPAYRFVAGEIAVELLVFSDRLRRRAPLSPIDGRAQRRISRAELEALVADDEPGG